MSHSLFNCLARLVHVHGVFPAYLDQQTANREMTVCRMFCQTTATIFFPQFAHSFARLNHTHHNVCRQRSRGTRAAWAVDVTATWTSQPASASVSLASLDASAKVPLNRAFLIVEHIIAPGKSSLNPPLIVSSCLNEPDWLYRDSVQQFNAGLNVFTAAFERRSVPACATLAMVELSAQVRLASFCSHMCGFHWTIWLVCFWNATESISTLMQLFLLHLLFFKKFE